VRAWCNWITSILDPRERHYSNTSVLLRLHYLLVRQYDNTIPHLRTQKDVKKVFGLVFPPLEPSVHMLPLSGIRVIDVTRLLPGGFCSMLLADMGAEVVKVEEPGLGDYMRLAPPLIEGASPFHSVVNRNKMSLGLNLKEKEGKDILKKLVASSDVFVEGFRPGVMERLGFSFDFVKKINPKIVYCSISAFGHFDPMSSIPGHDINFQALSGALGSNGKPSFPVVQLADLSAGMYAAIGILAALCRRKKEGAIYVDVPIVQSLLSLLILPLALQLAKRRPPTPGDGLLTGSEAYYNLYKTSDGKYLAVAAIEKEFRRNLLRELGAPELESLMSGKRGERRLATRRLREILSRKGRDEWTKKLTGKETCVTPVLSMDEVMRSSWGRPTNVIGQVSSAEVKILPTALTFYPKRNEAHTKKAPRIGQDTMRVLRGLGYSAPQIRDLERRGIVQS